MVTPSPASGSNEDSQSWARVHEFLPSAFERGRDFPIQRRNVSRGSRKCLSFSVSAGNRNGSSLPLSLRRG